MGWSIDPRGLTELLLRVSRARPVLSTPRPRCRTPRDDRPHRAQQVRRSHGTCDGTGGVRRLQVTGVLERGRQPARDDPPPGDDLRDQPDPVAVLARRP